MSLNLLLAALALLLSTLVFNYGFFCLLIALSGAAQAPLWPACIKIITTHVEPNSFGIVVGLLGTAPYAGATFSAAFVSYITDLYGWRHSLVPIFLPCVIVSLIILVGVPIGPYSNVSKKTVEGNIPYSYIASLK